MLKKVQESGSRMSVAIFYDFVCILISFDTYRFFGTAVFSQKVNSEPESLE